MNDKQRLIDEWIAVANEDKKAATILLQNESGLNRTIAYHSQQYAEKMIKALLLKYDIVIKRTHNIDELLYLMNNKINITDELLDWASQLSGYAVEIRYPTGFEPTDAEAQNAYDISLKLIDSLYNTPGI